MSAVQKKTYTPRVNHGGNYCGHYPHAPKCFGVINKYADVHKHKLIKYAIRRLKTYYKSPDCLVHLSKVLANGDRRSINKNGQYRQVHSCRRDHIAMVLAYLFSHTNLLKLQVGIVPYHNAKDLYVPYKNFKDIGEQLELSEAVVSKVINHLKHVGLLSVTERRLKDENGVWRSRPAIITFNKVIFVLLGVSAKWLEMAREYCSRDWHDERYKRFSAAVDRHNEKHAAEARATTLFQKRMLKQLDDIRTGAKRKKIVDIGVQAPKRKRKVLDRPPDQKDTF